MITYYLNENGLQQHYNLIPDLDEQMLNWSEDNEPEPEEALEF